MKKGLLFVLSTLLFLVPLQASAADAGKAAGKFIVGRDAVKIKQSYAYLYDNAEGWGMGKEIRILLSENPVPEQAMTATDVTRKLNELMKQGKLRGVLLIIDADNKNSMILMNDYYPTNEVNSTWRIKMLESGGKSPVKGLKITDSGVTGTLKHQTKGDKDIGRPAEKYEISFDTPFIEAPSITANLTGEMALKAPQTVALLAKFAAIFEGDTKGAMEHCTDKSKRELDARLAKDGEYGMAQLQREYGFMEELLKKERLRLVERGDRATLVIQADDGQAMYEFVKEGEKWKSD